MLEDPGQRVAAISPKPMAEPRQTKCENAEKKEAEIKQLNAQFSRLKNEVSKVIKESRVDHKKAKKAMKLLKTIVSKLATLDPSFEPGGWYGKMCGTSAER